MKIFLMMGVASVLFLISCEPAATFTEPQPAGTANESRFSNNIQGDYWSDETGELLHIGDQYISSQYNEIEKIHKDSLERYYQLMGDTLYNVKTGLKERVELRNDTINIYRNYTDTLFSISDNELLKRWKGYYFLNTKHSDSAWEVQQLLLQRGKLTIGEISSLADINALQELTATVGDSSSTTFSLNKNQFKKFVRKNGFRKRQTYSRVSISKQ